MSVASTEGAAAAARLPAAERAAEVAGAVSSAEEAPGTGDSWKRTRFGTSAAGWPGGGEERACSKTGDVALEEELATPAAEETMPFKMPVPTIRLARSLCKAALEHRD